MMEYTELIEQFEARYHNIDISLENVVVMLIIVGDQFLG